MSQALIDSLEHELAHMLARVGAVQACLDALKLQGESAPRARRRIGRASTATTDSAVVCAIKAGHTTTTAIVAETALPTYNVRQALKRLVKTKAITKTGATASLRYAVGK